MQFVFVRVISVALFFGFAGTVLLAEEKPEAILAAAKSCPRTSHNRRKRIRSPSGSSRDSVRVYDNRDYRRRWQSRDR